MYNGLLHAHSGWRWVALILLVAAILQAFGKGNETFTKQNGKVMTFAMIALHIQFLLGLILLFISPKVDFGNMMADDMTRFYTLEHTVMMLVSVGLVTMGRKIGLKKGSFRAVAMYYLIALIVILAAIPWPFRGFGAGWF